MSTIISTLASLAIAGVVIVGGLQVTLRYHAILEYRSTLKKLDYTLALAQSLALTTQKDFKVCPSQIDIWDKGWNIQNNAGQKVKELKHQGTAIIKLENLGNSICVNIKPNGMSHNNGHFSYHSRNVLYPISMRLVFNQGLRTYIRKDY